MAWGRRWLDIDKLMHALLPRCSRYSGYFLYPLSILWNRHNRFFSFCCVLLCALFLLTSKLCICIKLAILFLSYGLRQYTGKKITWTGMITRYSYTRFEKSTLNCLKWSRCAGALSYALTSPAPRRGRVHATRVIHR